MLDLKAVYQALLPPGAIWQPKPDGEFDRLLQGMGDNAGVVYDFLKALASIRDPDQTIMLDDLEKEYGIVKNNNISEAIRRAQISSIKYAKRGTGSKDDLQDRLDKAGFDLIVTPNDPAFDPRPLLQSQYNMVAGGDNAYAGYHEGGPILAYAGMSGGYLIVNGDLFFQSPAYEMQAGGENAFAGNSLAIAGYFVSLGRELYIYEIPDDPNRWRFIFFVGGEATGFDNLLPDGNMELPDTSQWTPGDPTNTTLVKDTSIRNSGARSLRVEIDGNSNFQNIRHFFDAGDVFAYFMNDNGSGFVYNSGWKNYVTDGNMERTGVSNWTAGNSAILTKVGAPPFATHLNIAYGGVVNPYASQSALTIGRTYRLVGMAKGNGTFAPFVQHPLGTTLWTGTATASWQHFDITFTASVETNLYLFGNCSGAGFVDFDEVWVFEPPIIADPDMEAAGVGSWSVGNSATLTKETSDPHSGTRSLRVAYNGVTDPYAYQNSFITGEDYYIFGFAKSDGSITPRIDVGGTTIWTGTNSTEWQFYEVYFRAAGTQLQLVAETATGGYVEFDDIYTIPPTTFFYPIMEDRATNNGATNTDTELGKGLYFDGNSYITVPPNTGNTLDNRFTCAAWIWTSETGRAMSIISRRTASVCHFDFGIDTDGKLYFYDGITFYKSNTAVNDGQRHHVGVVIFGTNSEFYLDGVSDSGYFTPTVTPVGALPIVGAYNNGLNARFEGTMILPTLVSAAAGPSYFNNMMLQAEAIIANNGSYAEQLVSTIAAGAKVRGYAWGDGAGSIPSVLIKNPVSGDWDLEFYGIDSAIKQSFDFIAADGIDGIRLVGGKSYFGQVNFDDIFIGSPSIEVAQVPSERRDELYKIILQTKPLHSWCGLVVEFV